MSVTDVERDAVDLGEFRFECGETISSLEIAYESYGEFTGDNAVLVCHALTGSQNVASYNTPGTAGQARAWWGDIVGPGKAIDTTEYYVVCANVPGSCYGSSGPSSINPETGEPWASEFPPVTIGDWTRAQRRLLDHLGVGRLRLIIGGSVGGMNVLEWAKQFPDDADRIAPIAAAANLDPQCLALDAIARRAIRSDPNWNGGDYYGTTDENGDRTDGSPPKQGLAIARQLGHIMYLSKASMERKFGRRSAGRDSGIDASAALFPPDAAGAFFPYREVESYLDYNADQFTERFDANSYLYLTRAMDDYDLAEGHGTAARAISAFEGEVLCVSFTGDWHFTVGQSEALARAFRSAGIPVAHHVVDSDHGHDAFLVEPEHVGPPVADFLDNGLDGRAITDTDEDEKKSDDVTEFAPVHTSLFSG